MLKDLREGAFSIRLPLFDLDRLCFDSVVREVRHEKEVSRKRNILSEFLRIFEVGNYSVTFTEATVSTQ